MACQMEIARQQEEAKRQRAIDKARKQMEREQQEEIQVWARAVMVTQGGGTPGPSSAVAVPMPRACKRCTVLLQEPKGCVVSEWGKVRACLPCQKHVRHASGLWGLEVREQPWVAGPRRVESQRQGK